jgi:hypothetical protein
VDPRQSVGIKRTINQQFGDPFPLFNQFEPYHEELFSWPVKYWASQARFVGHFYPQFVCVSIEGRLVRVA